MKTTNVTISVQWGSEFQKEVGDRILMESLEAWKRSCEEHHKSTIIKIETSDR
jgi:hypothetical protein